QQVAQIAERLEIAIGQSAHIRRKTQAKKVERIDVTLGMREPNQIDSTGSAFDQGLQRSVRAFLRKIAEERIARSKRQEAESDALFALSAFINAVDDFVGGAVAADGDEAAIALLIRFAGEFDGVARPGGGHNVDLQSFFTQASRGRPGQFSRAAATRGWVDD